MTRSVHRPLRSCRRTSRALLAGVDRVRGVVANMPEFARAFSCDAARTLPEAERGDIW